MKKILKFLLMPVFVFTPVMTVIACGPSGIQVSNEDILSSAIGQMQDHTFNMSEELNLSQLPNDNAAYSTLGISVRQRIQNYYRELVQPGLNWDYPAVSVSVRADVNNSRFLTRYGANVESRINITAYLTYKNLTANKDIVVKINNDTTNNEQKIKAIGDYLKIDYLNAANPTFSFSTLLPDGILSDASGINSVYAKITSELRRALFVDKLEAYRNIPIIDVDGVNLSIQGPTTSLVIYNLDQNAINTTNNSVTGKLQNLILTLEYADGTQYHISVQDDLSTQNLKIAQDFSSVNTQVANILNQGSGLNFATTSALPTPGTTLSTYDPGPLRTQVTEQLFNYIAKVYPDTKMGATWGASNITIDNADSTPYIEEDANHGYFLMELMFTSPAGSETISALVSNVKLNLVKTA